MNVEIANKLVSLRKQMGLSQEGLAEKIGVSRQAVSKWERSESSPDTENLIALSRIYGISIDEMLDYDINSKLSSELNSPDEPIIPPIQDSIEEDEESKKDSIDFSGNFKFEKNSHNKFPVAILVTIIYLFIGIVFDLWHPGWIIFLAIPVFHVLISDKRNKDEIWKALPYPIICVIIFLLLGSLFDGWSYAWLIFLTIPIWAYFIKK